jgi:predicted metal-dependent peptidase
MSTPLASPPAEAHPFDLPLLVFHLRTVSPFFGALALFSENLITESVETAATDGRRLLFNPAFMASHPVDQQLAIVVHELLHAALRHVERRATADPLLWNIAADIVVNGMIAQTSGLKLPASAVRDPKLEEFPVEEVYQVLLQRHGLPKKIRFLPGDLLPPEEKNEPSPGGAPGSNLSEHWNSALAQAAVVARMGEGQGRLPAGIERALAAATNPPLDWRALLWRHLTRTPVDFTSYDRRFLGEEMYLDALDGESVRVAACVDTSGSIGGQELGRFLNELRAILAAYPAIDLDLYTCDTDLRGPWKLASGDFPTPKWKGGGGTSFIPFFEALQKSSPAPDTAVYLTDGFGDFPQKAPHHHTLWVVTPGGLPSHRFPFGETARMLD